MRIYELSQRGEFHVNHNEDFKLHSEIGSNRFLISVMDGCSSGTDSHFASNLIGKCLRKIAKDIGYKEFASKRTLTLKEIVKEVAQKLFSDLVHFNSRLDLKYDELLSTVIFGVVDQSSKQGELNIIGDGLVVINGEFIEYEQGNKPDYIGYHLNDDFEKWYQSQVDKISISKVEDISISTDGVFTFKKFDNEDYPKIKESQILDFFFDKEPEGNEEVFLRKRLYELEKKYGLKPSDDITIIRVIDDTHPA